MRNSYALFLVVLLCNAAHAWGQAYGELDINNARARFYANGRVSLDTLSSTAHFEIPQGGSATSLYVGGLWIGGQTPGGQLRLSSTLYDQYPEVDFYPGPLTTTGGTTTQAISDQYDRVWSVTKAEIATHLAYFQCLGDPTCDVAIEFPGGYTIPASIQEWPAIGQFTLGYDLYLAPFYDYDQDGDYVPANGDAPCILGDQALFNVFNDHLSLQSGDQPMGIEVQAMPFAYNSDEPALDGTVFIRYKLVNRSTQTYTNTMLGFFNDFDLGCANDDFIGCDPSRNLAYVYNWDENDEGCLGGLGFGTQPPAFGMVLLKGPLMDANAEDDPASNELPNWNGHGFGDAIVDNERYGLAHFMYFNRDAPSTCCNGPYTEGDHYNYLRGIWKDGVTMSYGGVGYNPDPNALACAFMFPGAGDPVGAGTGGAIQGPWSEVQQVLPDRRGLMSMGAFTLVPGQHMDLMFAYVYARAASGGALASVAALQARVDSVSAFASTLPIWNVFEVDGFHGQCVDYPFLGVPDQPAFGRLTLFPSPAAEQVRFDAPSDLMGGMLTLCDAIGRIVLRQRVVPGMNDIDISLLAKGVYTCEAVTSRARFTGRVVKE